MGLLIRNTLAVLPAGNGHAIGRHDLYIEGGDIAGIDEAPVGFATDEAIDGTRLLTIPGLVNAHTHTYLSTLHNTTDDLGFGDWLFGAIAPAERRLEPEDSYWASLLSQAEMIRSGTTCFSDMEMHVGQTTRAVSGAPSSAAPWRETPTTATTSASPRRCENATSSPTAIG